jgi:hypothetical protein
VLTASHTPPIAHHIKPTVPLPEMWMQRVCSRSVPAVLDLYVDDGVLIPTYDKSDLPGAGLGVLRGKRQMAHYFQRFLGKQDLCGTIDTTVVQTLGTVEVFSGVYTFQWIAQGVPQTAGARYTFVTIPTPAGPRIVTHHSSQLPARQAP